MDKLLKAWGLNFDGTKVVADLEFVGRTREGRQPAVLAEGEREDREESEAAEPEDASHGVNLGGRRQRARTGTETRQR